MKPFKLPFFDKTHSHGKSRQSNLEAGSVYNPTNKGKEPEPSTPVEVLTRQLDLLRTISDISRELSTQLNPQSLLNQAVTLIQKKLNLYYAGVFIGDEPGQKAILRAGSGEIGLRLLNQHYFLPIDEKSTVGWSMANRKPRISSYIPGDPLLSGGNPELPLTRSEIALPILDRAEMTGVLTLQSDAPHAFEDSDFFIYQTLADSIGIALSNAEQFQMSQAQLKEISAQYRKSLEHTWSETAGDADSLSFTFENPGPSGSEGPLNSVQLPITIRDQLIGRVTMELGKESLSPEELAFVDTITIQTSLALENARLLEETQRQVSREQLINRISGHFSRAVNIEEILKAALQELGHLPSVSEVSVFLSSAENSSQSNES